MKKKILVRGPVLSQSGYGEQSRFALRALKSKEDLFDIFILPTSWGKTGWIWENNDERQWLDGIIKKTQQYLASGGQFDWSTGKIQSNSTDFNLAELSNLGNSILGGNNTFPDGPDIITITVRPIDTNNITADGQFSVSGRLSWSESQA